VDLKATTAATYGATADHFDDAALSFWERFGSATAERLDLRPGERILDACCGTGASALPAAQQVGEQGRVIGIDLSEGALALARAKAVRLGLDNVEFRAGDVEASGLPPASFDAVVCVFGIFFLPDMSAGVRELWRLLRPGGRLALTVWGPDIFEPATTAFWDAVGSERPDLVGRFHPWNRITTPEALAALLADSDVAGADVVPEAGSHPVGAVEDWWTIVLGSGYRATVEQLGAQAAERVREANIAALRRRRVRSIATNVIYATATKPR
jgi:SAM-dependent methyltransferase